MVVIASGSCWLAASTVVASACNVPTAVTLGWQAALPCLQGKGKESDGEDAPLLLRLL